MDAGNIYKKLGENLDRAF